MRKKLAEQPDIKALLIVHLFGQACDMDPLLDVVKKHGLLLVEDCAQAHGAMYKGRRVGTFGDAAAFSFYPTKNMTTGEGGMMLTPHQEVAEKARLLINHGMKVRYHHDIVGYNYRMTNMAASIGLCQLDKLDRFNALRNRNAAFLRRAHSPRGYRDTFPGGGALPLLSSIHPADQKRPPGRLYTISGG